MTSALPEGIDPEDEIQIEWKNDDLGVKITASLGEATITIETSHESAPIVPWLVAALPAILESTWDSIQAQDAEGDDEEPAGE